jgi:hypothetical protein
VPVRQMPATTAEASNPVSWTPEWKRLPAQTCEVAAGAALNKLRGAVRGASCSQLAGFMAAGGDGGVAVVARRGQVRHMASAFVIGRLGVRVPSPAPLSLRSSG